MSIIKFKVRAGYPTEQGVSDRHTRYLRALGMPKTLRRVTPAANANNSAVFVDMCLSMIVQVRLFRERTDAALAAATGALFFAIIKNRK